MEPSDKFPLEKEAFEHVKKLISLRSRTPALQYASLFTLYADYFVYVYLREFRGSNVIVAINNGHEPMPSPLAINMGNNSNIPPRIKKNLEGRQLVNQTDFNTPSIQVTNGLFEIQLPGKTAAVYM